MNRAIYSLIALLLVVVATPAEAGKIRLGSVSLMDQKDRDVVRLDRCNQPGNKKVTRLQVQVDKFDAEINRLKVEFHNGETQLLNVRERFRAGTTSRWIDLSGNARCIQQITIIGDSDTRARSNRRQSRVTFWGFYPDKPTLKPDPEIKPVPIPVQPAPNTVGVLLGEVRLTDAKDRDVVLSLIHI